jgi:RNA polymerase sigma-70 factor, ECF subfamily
MSVHRNLDQHLPALWRFALVLTRNSDRAKDLVQNTCLRALEKAHLFEAGTQLDRWLMKIMVNIWRNEQRANKIRMGTGVEDAENVLQFDGFEKMETNIFASEVLIRVGQLPVAQRETVLLVYLEGWSYAEAAEALAVPIGTIMSRLAAARAQLSALNPHANAVRKST